MDVQTGSTLPAFSRHVAKFSSISREIANVLKLDICSSSAMTVLNYYRNVKSKGIVVTVLN
jgi:hypothetical protein